MALWSTGFSEVQGKSRNPRWWIQDGCHFAIFLYHMTSLLPIADLTQEMSHEHEHLD